MKRYWDASALIDALHDARVEALAFEPDQWTRSHALAEAFSTLTGGRLGIQYLADDASELIRELTARFQFVDLNADETQAALDECQRRGVRGGRVHDWLHAVAARKAGVKQLLTDNVSDFSGLEQGFRVVAP